MVQIFTQYSAGKTMELIFNSIKNLESYQDLVAQLKSASGCHALGLPRSARLPILATLYSDLKNPILLITDRADHARSLVDELVFWLPATKIHLFPEPTPLFYEDAGWGQATRLERIQALILLARYHLPYGSKPENPPIIVASARALMTRTMTRREFLKATALIKSGQIHVLKDLLAAWVRIGYKPADTVLEPGQISHRGGLLDIWPPDEIFPVRLDFFDNEVENIRRFDPISQRTVEKVDEIVVTPAREYILPDAFNEDGASNREVSEFDIPVLHPLPASLLDYLPQRASIMVNDLGMLASLVADHEEAAIKLRQENLEEGILNADFPIPYVSWTEIADDLNNKPCLELGRSSLLIDEQRDSEILSSVFSLGERFAGRLKPFMAHVTKLIDEKARVVIVSRQSGRLEELWFENPEHKEEPQAPMFIESSLSEGWCLKAPGKEAVHLLTDSEIFGWVRPQARMRPQISAETPETVYEDLTSGDWVVHVDYGIGRFTGLVERTLDGLEREFLSVEYKNGDQVFVPIYQADRITRYMGASGGDPVVGQLGTQEWQETKRRAKQAVQEVASELLDLYASRHVAKGFAFSKDNAWQSELENSFPYVETTDQVRVIDDVKKGMESARPMDRLLCGDVGYGKTEVALRAAFKAVMDGKQVAVLVPTTVLAQQHYDTFRQRLSTFPVSVEMLSRFRTQKEQGSILYGMAQGAVDIIIGTHRLIQADVEFKDLGLVIIDEEQRFGVTHKEYLKRLRNEVDVLTLTATPIPRTLYMALTGVRDISQLNTPPEERLPVVTHIGPYSQKLVRQAILRELDRGGQIFFVHNRVQTIDAMKMHLNKLVPEARVEIGHGQMPEQILAAVMRNFTAGEVDVLLCTSIIESGLDIPNANTLIVDRGDTFGLAQLYQLRGRVGRGAVRAYAYFFRHRKKPPTIEGQERLDVIAENTQLGSGYSIAMRDLEMRGAGELLGNRQHGYIASVGFHLYTRLLAAAVRSQRRERGMPVTVEENNFLKEVGVPVNVDLPLATGIPSNYIPDQSLRLRLYRRLADITDEASLEALEAEFSDRFGAPPEMVLNLFYQMQVKLRAEAAGLASISFDSGQIVLRYPQLQNGVENDEVDKTKARLKDVGSGIRSGKNAYWLAIGKELDWRERLLTTLTAIRNQD
jgi:transcription-repair coupling factor (superfamily II helicase)